MKTSFDILEFVSTRRFEGCRLYTDDDGNRVMAFSFTHDMISDVYKAAFNVIVAHLDDINYDLTTE